MTTFELDDGQAVARVKPRIHRHTFEVGREATAIEAKVAEYRLAQTLFLTVLEPGKAWATLGAELMLSIAAHYEAQGWRVTTATTNAATLARSAAPADEMRPNPYFVRLGNAFPDYDQASLPLIPTGFLDQSWGADACPFFFHPRLQLSVSIEDPEPSNRQTEGPRFVLCATDLAGAALEGPPLLHTDDWRAVQTQILAHLFALRLKQDLGQPRFDDMRERNRDIGEGHCASHDFVDANMVMNAAFIEVAARELDAERDDDVELWNTAWDIAKRLFLTASPAPEDQA